MKKTIALILSVVLVLTMALPAFAATDTKEIEKVILSVKDRIGDTDAYKEFRSSVNTVDGVTVYQLVWTTNDQDEYRMMRVDVTESGIITDYYNSDEQRIYSDKPSVRKTDRKTAFEKAKVLAAAFNPSVANEIVLVNDTDINSLYDTGFTFGLKRVVNGVDVIGDTGYITVNEEVSKILSYSLNYTENAAFDSKDSIISLDDAKKAYAEKCGLKMEYRSKYDRDGKKIVIYPVFAEKNSEYVISALTGEAITLNGSYSIMNRFNGAGAAQDSSSAKEEGLSKAEISELSNISGLKSKEEGIEIIKNNTYIGLKDGMNVTEYTVRKKWNTDSEYVACYYFADESYKNTLSVTMNALTGEITDFWKSAADDKDEKATLTRADADTKLTAVAAELAGDKFAEFKENENEVSDEAFAKSVRYSKSYTRMVNGIPFPDDSLSISISLVTGEILSYSLAYTTAEFPALDGALSEQQAIEKLFEQIPFELSYRLNVRDDKTREFKLVYDFSENYFLLDALTGNAINYNKEPIEKPFTGYTDISGHYAEKIINTLAEYGIRTEGDKFTPDAEINQGAFLKMIDLVFFHGGTVWLNAKSPYDYSSLFRNGITDKKDIDESAPVTRMDAAKFLIRAMGAEEYAKLDGIYASPFNDVTDGKGYVCLLYGMKVVNGDENGNFNPNTHLTFADAAVLIYNYLTR